MSGRLMTDDEMQAVQIAAEVAITADVMVMLPRVGLVVVPDTVMLEGIANGEEIGDPVTFRRGGRSVAVYAMPEVKL